MKTIVTQIIKKVGGNKPVVNIAPNGSKATLFYASDMGDTYITLLECKNSDFVTIGVTQGKTILRKDIVNKKYAAKWVNRDGAMFSSMQIASLS